MNWKITLDEWERLRSDVMGEMRSRHSKGIIDDRDMTYLAVHMGEVDFNIRCGCHSIPKCVYAYFGSVACGGPIFPSPWNESRNYREEETR